ncbi:MAG: class I SAM-dependent methyltransferase [Deinococcales bacterium]|nr:class I SAM-dependent methyltransferase [Deinococcales bacterium]
MARQPAVDVVVVADGAQDEGAARAWAARLGLTLAAPDAPSADALQLRVGADGLALRTAGGQEVRAAAHLLGRRRPGQDLLARAVGPAGEVVDATAGLGADAFHLAAGGTRVTMVERVPLVAALLEDALERARGGALGAEARAAAARLALTVGDARAYLAQRAAAADPPDVVLLDPMYPQRGKAALPGKGMALFRELVGEDPDVGELLAVALGAAARRVVVKRPLKAPPLAGVKPSGSLRGTTTRYDLYAPRRRGP